MTDDDQTRDETPEPGAEPIEAGVEVEAEMADTAPATDGDVAEGDVEEHATVELDDAALDRAIEAIVMVATDPVPEDFLATLLDQPMNRIAARCRALSAEYGEQRRGFELVPIAGGWRFQSHPLQAEFVERFVLEPQSSRMSTAALETLSIIAYKQPISRAQVSAIRGVNVDGVLRTLVTRGYVEEVARDSGPGQAVLYGTTDEFCSRLGLASAADLPPLGAFVPSAEIVEALEQTLRAEPDSPAIDLGDDAGEHAPESADDAEMLAAATGDDADPA